MTIGKHVYVLVMKDVLQSIATHPEFTPAFPPPIGIKDRPVDAKYSILRTLGLLLTNNKDKPAFCDVGMQYCYIINPEK